MHNVDESVNKCCRKYPHVTFTSWGFQIDVGRIDVTFQRLCSAVHICLPSHIFTSTQQCDVSKNMPPFSI